MIINLAHASSVIQNDESDIVIVTRPTIHGKMATHAIKSPYDCWTIARYLHARFARMPTLIVQDMFPMMSDEDREFLITGITPEEWKRTIATNDGEA